MTNKFKTSSVAVLAGVAMAGFAAGRWSAPPFLLDTRVPHDERIATFSGGALGTADLRDTLTATQGTKQHTAAVEHRVRMRLLAKGAEEAGLHRTPDFLRRYEEELAKAYMEEAFEKPFQKQLPTEAELKAFFEKHQAQLGRPERVRVAHVALLAPATEAAARMAKRKEAEALHADLKRSLKDEYAFGRVAITRSEDARSRPAAGELPFLTREELAARLGPEVAEAAFSLAPGALTESVIETSQGFQLVKLLAREEGRNADYGEVKEAIRTRLTAERRAQAWKKFTDDIWKKADVRIDDAALERLAAELSQHAK